MDFLKDSAFWWALIASIWAVLSDYLGANPNIKANGVSELLMRIAGTVINSEAGHSRRNQRNRRGRR